VVAEDVLLDAIPVEGRLGKGKVRCLGPTAIGDAVARVDDAVVCVPVNLHEPLLAGAAQPAVLVGVGEGHLQPFSLQETAAIGVKGNVGEMVNLEHRLDVDIEPVAHDLDVDSLTAAVLMKGGEVRINVGVVPDEAENILLTSFRIFVMRV